MYKYNGINGVENNFSPGDTMALRFKKVLSLGKHIKANEEADGKARS